MSNDPTATRARDVSSHHPRHLRARTWLAPALGLGLCAMGCSGEGPAAEAVNVTATSAAPQAEADDGLRYISLSRPLMGTIFRINVVSTQEIAEPAIRAAFAEIARLEDALSEWREDSEISRINREAGRAPVTVGPDVLAVVKAGLDVSRWSEGAFDLSWAALRGMYSFPPHEERVPSARDLRRQLPLVRYQDIIVDEAASTVFLRRAGMAIGTGGIGKGYALDRAGEVLREAGINDYMIFGGGQVQVHGQRGSRDWRVGIQHPRQQGQNSYFAALEATDVSISTSGDYEHAFFRDGRRYHHIIDLQTGLPVDKSMSVTLLAPAGLYADALSTAVFAMGAERALEMLRTIDYRAEAVIVDGNCRVHTTPGTDARLRLNVELRDGLLPDCTP
ncbi:MAG: FAD:protein FMN transferase [Myxococcales bacterium]|nr:FAD:protein FMN transferase [Myxococcales bacterium]